MDGSICVVDNVEDCGPRAAAWSLNGYSIDVYSDAMTWQCWHMSIVAM